VLERRTSRFFQKGSDSSSSSSSDHGSPSSHSGSHHGSTGKPPSDFSSGKGSLNEKPKAKAHTQQTKIAFSQAARDHLNDLGLKGKERKKVKKEHVNRIKQEMKKNGATHATVEHLAHGGGTHVAGLKPSADKNVHITASFHKMSQGASGNMHRQDILSDHGTPKHHVYSNMEDKTKGKEAVVKHMPAYHGALTKKYGTPDYHL
jgi:hypothetical protein